MISLNRVSPPRTDSMNITAAGLLFGDALIVGAGHWVGPRTAMLSDEVETLTVVEKDLGIYKSCPLRISEEIYFSVIHSDVFEYRPNRSFSSIYYNPFPLTPYLELFTETIISWLKVSGRLVILDFLFNDVSKLFDKVSFEQTINVGHPSRNAKVSSYLKRCQ